MAVSPANFLFNFLLFCVALLLTFIFSSALLAWILSRIFGASVGYCVGGCNSLKDVVVKFKKGAIDSVSIGEIKLSLRYHSLLERGMGFSSWDPKLILLIRNLEVSMRPSNKSPEKNKSSEKKKTRKSSGRAPGRGKWKTISNVARYLSVCVTDLVLKTPKYTLEIRELNVDTSKGGGFESDLLVRVQILPIVVQIVQPEPSCDQLSNSSGGGCSASSQVSDAAIEKNSPSFICEKFSISCEFRHDRNIGSNVDSVSEKQPSKKPQILAGYSSRFPEKVSFNLLKLNVSFAHREYGLSVENNIVGIQLKSIKSRSSKHVEESTRLHFQLEFSEIHLFREGGSSILEILKLGLVSFVYVPVQSVSLVRAETEIKLGGFRCNIIMSRIKPWLLLPSSKKKKIVLREEAPVVKPKSTDSKTITWTCKLSAPDVTIVLFNMAGSPLYQVVVLLIRNLSPTYVCLS